MVVVLVLFVTSLVTMTTVGPGSVAVGITDDHHPPCHPPGTTKQFAHDEFELLGILEGNP